MSLAIEQLQPVPLATDADGVVRVAGTRVTLDTIVNAFQDGATAEEIAQQYSTLALGDIYSVLGYYLRHKDDVATYLAQRTANRERIRRENERRSDANGVRERLIQRGSKTSH